MIIYHRTSIMESSAQTAVNTVNCVGVMGKGLAAAFKKRYPDMFAPYQDICDRKLLEPGKLWLWKGADQWVLNFPTKNHWRSPSKIEWIEAGLAKFADNYKDQGISEVAFPKLGCGNGNLDWSAVRPVMERHLNPLPITVFIHDYEVDMGLPEHIEALISRNLQQSSLGSFDEVWNCLVKLSELVGDRMVDFEDGSPFSLHFKSDIMLMQSGAEAEELAREELYEVWRSLVGGMLTKKKIDFASPELASKLISVFSLLPSVRPVSIQPFHSKKQEIAAELVDRKMPTRTPEGGSQLSLTWR